MCIHLSNHHLVSMSSNVTRIFQPWELRRSRSPYKQNPSFHCLNNIQLSNDNSKNSYSKTENAEPEPNTSVSSKSQNHHSRNLKDIVNLFFLFFLVNQNTIRFYQA